jgi:uncharacterized protein GlcG (DUF336 family)
VLAFKIGRQVLIASLLVLCASLAMAQAPVRPPYGTAINLETAKKVMAAAMTESKKNGWKMAVAIVDNHGMLICYEMQDDTQTASADIAVGKARTSATLRRPSQELEKNIADGRVAVLGLGHITPIEGGLPIVVDGKMIGAIGVSGMASTQDAQVARAGLDALK